MATDVKPPIQAASEGDQCVVLRGIGWKGYTTLLRLRGERSSPKMLYLDGDLWFRSPYVVIREIDWKGYKAMLRLRGERSSPRMLYLDGEVSLVSPAYSHERLADRFDTFVKEVVVGLNIPCIPTRSTTFRRGKKVAGVEGDATFYLANEALIRGKDEIDLRVDPPPDLAIEAVNTHGASAAVEIYRRLGVPEVWVGDQDELRILALQENRKYLQVSRSVAFPFLTADEIFEWVSRLQTDSETQWILDLRRWVQDTLVPRRQEGLADPPRET